MIRVFTHAHGKTSQADRVDPAWLAPGSGVLTWVDLMNPSGEEGLSILRDVFHFHELAVEDALSELQFPKVESYGAYLYLILHRIDFEALRKFPRWSPGSWQLPTLLVEMATAGLKSLAETSSQEARRTSA